MVAQESTYHWNYSYLESLIAKHASEENLILCYDNARQNKRTLSDECIDKKTL